jgi:hypothetical protein
MDLDCDLADDDGLGAVGEELVEGEEIAEVNVVKRPHLACHTTKRRTVATSSSSTAVRHVFFYI